MRKAGGDERSVSQSAGQCEIHEQDGFFAPFLCTITCPFHLLPSVAVCDPTPLQEHWDPRLRMAPSAGVLFSCWSPKVRTVSRL